MTSPAPPSPRYPYRPLNHSTHEIRLLHLTYSPSPTPTDNPPEPAYTLAIIHHPLTPQPTSATTTTTTITTTTAPKVPLRTPKQFTALSYVWGSAQDTLPLHISPHADPIPVTRNLHSAIARLARQRRGLAGGGGGCYLWVDALCINQEDTAEKNAQVALMGRIYALAQEVLVWLGNEADGDDGGAEVVRGLFAAGELGALFRSQVPRDAVAGRRAAGRVEAFVRTVLQWAVTSDHGAGGGGGGGGEGTGGRPRVGFDFEAIWRLFRGRPWWRRVWVIQEVVLARKAVVLCGADPDVAGASVSWEDVSECIRLLEWMILFPNTAPEHRRLYALLGDIYPNVSHLALASDGYKRSVEEAKGEASQAGMPLLDTIIWTSLGTSADGAIQATDPRDRIFGLLGMVREEDRRRIPVDYSSDMTISRVLFAVGRALLQDHGPDIFSFCQGTPGLSASNAKEVLPSWVLDWTAPRMIASIGGVYFGNDSETELRGNASKGANWKDWAPKCRVADVVYDQPVVSLMGVVLGRVERVGREFNAAPGSPDYLDKCREWLLEVRKMVEESGDSKGATLDEIWRVPIADFGLGKRADIEGPDRFIHGFDVLTGKVAVPPGLDTDAARRDWMSSESWPYRRAWKLYERRAFLDDAGRPGLGPKAMAIGDRVVVLAGGHVPFILREELGTSTSPRYRVLGTAYTYGLMDGEGVQGDMSFSEIQVV